VKFRAYIKIPQKRANSAIPRLGSKFRGLQKTEGPSNQWRIASTSCKDNTNCIQSFAFANFFQENLRLASNIKKPKVFQLQGGRREGKAPLTAWPGALPWGLNYKGTASNSLVPALRPLTFSVKNCSLVALSPGEHQSQFWFYYTL